MNIRQILEEREVKTLSPYASLSINSRGRQNYEEPCAVRTDFQRDRDRIIHCKAFRRLIHKTQVFFSPEGDHYRTRLTHTLEVSQIARTISRALFLNEDLTEAIALGHDLGHTPFGHAGEEVLNDIMKKKFNSEFTHNKQSLRVVDCIEREGQGLNLTWEVRDGILNHSGDVQPSTLEGKIVHLSDRVAYINHDIDDAIRAGILREEDLPEDDVEILGRQHRDRINTLVRDIIDSSTDKPCISSSPKIEKAMLDLRNFLFKNIYIDSEAKVEEGKTRKMLSDLFWYFYDNCDSMPPEFIPKGKVDIPVCVCDYLAGMTDRYALSVYNELFIPKTWHIK
ncbi:MAG: deoxyguanosinetriphosphate triphosphohydrolase [Actinobacteria bacterium]|nr:deoxyguanosinetriphosphate triphosphohydrolase [Actinomycetota bacterium]